MFSIDDIAGYLNKITLIQLRMFLTGLGLKLIDTKHQIETNNYGTYIPRKQPKNGMATCFVNLLFIYNQQTFYK